MGKRKKKDSRQREIVKSDNRLLIAIAIPEELEMYASQTCVQVDKEFNRNFLLPENRPFVNYFLFRPHEGERKSSYHDNYSILTPEEFDPRPSTMEEMVDKYLNVGIPGTTIIMIRPPLVICDQEGQEEIERAFARFGYDQLVVLERRE